MLQLKDIAERMGGVHVKTAKRWWKKLNREQARSGKPLVAPDVIGHGPHKWKPATAERLIALYENYYSSKGTTPQIIRAKYTGDLTDARQIQFTFTSKKISCPKKSSKRRRNG